MTHLRVRLIVTGKVQGVFFRESTREQAGRLGVAGWVANLADPTKVEALLDGPGPAVRDLVRWCHRGPPDARVLRVEEFGGATPAASPLAPRSLPEAPLSGFRVLR